MQLLKDGGKRKSKSSTFSHTFLVSIWVLNKHVSTFSVLGTVLDFEHITDNTDKNICPSGAYILMGGHKEDRQYKINTYNWSFKKCNE